MEDLEETKPVEKCEQCNKNDGTKELHSCPFLSDQAGDDSLYCNCCDDCQTECWQST